MRRIPALCLVAVLSAVPAGCVTSGNDRLTLADRVLIETLAELDRPRREAVSSERSSLHGLDRSAWEQSLVLVPVDSTHHDPTYARRVLWVSDLVRQRAEYPTPESSMDLMAQREHEQIGEAVYGPISAIFDLVLIPYDFLAHRGWNADQRSPALLYERTASPADEKGPGLDPWSARTVESDWDEGP